jgi:hypothetical protein
MAKAGWHAAGSGPTVVESGGRHAVHAVGAEIGEQGVIDGWGPGYSDRAAAVSSYSNSNSNEIQILPKFD